MKARDLMTRDPAVIPAENRLSDAASLMSTLGVGMLPVVESQDRRRLVGVLTDRDIVVRCLAEGHRGECLVRDHMTRDVLVTVTADADVREIARKMEQYQVRRLPVVDTLGNVVGVVAQADLAKRLGPVNPDLMEEILERISTPGQLVP